MNVELEKKLLLREIALMSHNLVTEEEGYALFTDAELASLQSEDLEGLRRLRNRFRDLTRSLGGTKGRG